jgi:hypothetical protein
MHGDFSRSTFRREKQYAGVLKQQGRVELDADWNEQVDIAAYLDETSRRDIIGRSGVPKGTNGFRVADATHDGQVDFVLHPGRIYIDGVLCVADASSTAARVTGANQVEVADLWLDDRMLAVGQWIELRAPSVNAVLRRRIVAVQHAPLRLDLSGDSLAALNGIAGVRLSRLITYQTQPYLAIRDGELTDGHYLVYLHAWKRHVTALEDPVMREVALGGPDTATRLQTVWQARLRPVGGLNAIITEEQCRGFGCANPDPLWRPDECGSARLRARSSPVSTPNDLCVTPTDGGYQSLENHLYRVEIHDSGVAGAATFKWSRDNGIVTLPIAAISQNTITLLDLGRDGENTVAEGDWVELIGERTSLGNAVLPLRRVQDVDPITREITVAGAPLTNGAVTGVADLLGAGAALRRWDAQPSTATGPVQVPQTVTEGGWLDLENGVQVMFEPGSTYLRGDYWLVPARAILGDVLWPEDAPANPDDVPNPLFQPPHGVEHHHTPLAVLRVEGDDAQVVMDCRAVFPPLTRIDAEDVFFDNTECQLPDVVTVQDALERLCGETDLRFHNKHLHGWGVVCGLRVTCGPGDGQGRRRNVTVHDGYALDCDGNDIRLREDQTLDMLRLIDEFQSRNPDRPILTDGRGDASLILGLDQQLRHTFTIEPYDPKKNTVQAMLAGTLLMDFYNDCVKRIHDFLKEQLTPPEDERDLPAGPGTQRIAAIGNLLAQVTNPQTGQRLFLSRREHLILRDFYDALRALLQSETFCAMFEGARPFPDYPDQLGQMDTIFGKSQHDRLRLRPGGRDLYSVGAGLNPIKPATLLNRYDLGRGVLAEQIDPLTGTQPNADGTSDSGAGAVQDVAFSPDGRRIYVIVSTRNEQNTFFRAGRIANNGTITWGPVTTICGVKLVTLATTAADPNMVYAIGMTRVTVQSGGTSRVELRGTGLYKINPDNVDPTMTAFRTFNSVGHLVITPDGRAFATAAPDNTTPTTYRAVVGLQLPNGTPIFATGQDRIAVPEGVDDIAVFDRSKGAERETLYAVAGRANSQKSLMAFGLDGQTIAGPIDIPDTTVRLEAYGPTRMLLLSLEDDYSVRMLDMRTNQIVAGYLLPMQVGPLAITSDSQRQRVFVLNHLSNTITTANGTLFRPEFRFPLSTLAAYRKAAVEAFMDLAGGLLQYLKDCLCDHFLTNCPECTGEEKLYLGVVSIRDNQVYKVCNFTQRREVKSFPKLGYWLSLIPIMPFFDRAIEELCCRVLPEMFGRYVVPAFNEDQTFTAQPRVRTATLRGGVMQAQGLDLPGRVADLFRRGNVAGNLLGARLSQPTERFAVTQPRITSTDIVGQPVNEAEERLKVRGAEVKRVAFDPVRQRGLVSSISGLFRQPAAGDQVTLYVENDRVKYFSVAGGAPETRELRSEVTSLAETVTRRETELQELRGRVESHQATVAEVERLRAELTDTRSQLGERDQQLATLRNQVRNLTEQQSLIETRVSDTRIREMESELRELRDFREEVRRFMRRPPNQ